MDTKHKEFLGLLFRQGRLYTQRAKRALDHDFPSAALGVIYPHGFYDIKRNRHSSLIPTGSGRLNDLDLRRKVGNDPLQGF